MEAILNSPAITAAVTGIFALSGTIAVYLLSKKKPKKHSRKTAPEDFIGYENLIKEINENNTEQHRLKDAELRRLYERDTSRDALIDILRAKENELYKIIEAKNQEISQLRHLREYSEAAKRVPQATMRNNTKAQSEKNK